MTVLPQAVSSCTARSWGRRL